MVSGGEVWSGEAGVPLHIGVDAVEIARIAAAVERWGTRFLDRIYTSSEQGYCAGRVERLAGRFAAKEAISKALGTGVGAIEWREMELLPGATGRPAVTLHGAAARQARALGLRGLTVSITHAETLAFAVAVAT